MNNLQSIPSLLTIEGFCEKYPWAKPGQMRFFIFNRKKNGFSACIVRLGRRILLDEVKVFEWLKESNLAE
jgi:hypothetical protein